MPSTISFEPWRTQALQRSGWIGLHQGSLQFKQVRHGTKTLRLEALRQKNRDGVAWDVAATLEQPGQRNITMHHAGTTRSQAVAGAVEACISAFFNQR